jgi:hypothetical protein
VCFRRRRRSRNGTRKFSRCDDKLFARGGEAIKRACGVIHHWPLRDIPDVQPIKAEHHFDLAQRPPVSKRCTYSKLSHHQYR